MNVSVYIRSYARDFPWLEYCFRSIEMRLRGYCELIVQIPSADMPKLPRIPEGAKVHGATETCTGYIAQQISKLNCDALCRGDYILHIDSDCILTREIHVDEFFEDGKPMLLTREWDNVGQAVCWREPTLKATGLEPAFEYMACMPIIHRRLIYEMCRNRIAGTHKESANRYVARQETFSEFNCLGAVAAHYMPDKYVIRPAAPGTDNFPRMRQFYSWGGMTPEVMAEIAAAGL